MFTLPHVVVFLIVIGIMSIFLGPYAVPFITMIGLGVLVKKAFPHPVRSIETAAKVVMWPVRTLGRGIQSAYKTLTGKSGEAMYHPVARTNEVIREAVNWFIRTPQEDRKAAAKARRNIKNIKE